MEPEDRAESTKEELRAMLAKNIVSARKAKAKLLGRHYTQEKLAADSGISTTAIAQIERGEVDPRLSTITGIAVALEVNPVFLLFGRQEIETLHQMIEGLDAQSFTELSERFFSNSIKEINKLANSSLPRQQIKASQMGAGAIAMQINQQLAQNTLEVVDDSVKLSVGTSVGIGAAMAGIMGATIGALMGTPSPELNKFFPAKKKPSD
ncbi:MAG: helix-turn-helix transcriptional regulator [SAR324 cluster bacterium]|nr:helix-turn-helix transcriptional regulator [SAR324 cluster bacterium]